jgi:iron complex outermembrane recepter protein
MRTFCILFLIVVSVSSYASRGLVGRITDASGQPLNGALIYFPELNRSCTSDSDGYYKLENLPLRTLVVKFSFLGHTQQLSKVTVTNQNLVLNVGLEPSPVETEEIVVTGGQHSTQHENAVKIDVLKLDGPDVQRSPSLSEMLTRIPGLDMISKGSGVTKPVIRGLSMNDILMLNNGVRFENYQYSSHHPLGLDEFGTERVEVIKGPASLLYGSDAIGGVLNFINESPAPQHHVLGDYQLQLFSNSLGIHSSLGIKGAGEHFFGGLRLSGKSHADYLQGGGDYLANSRFNEVSVKANSGYNATFGSFRLYYDYSRENLGMVEPEALEGIQERGRTNEIYFQRLNTHLLSTQNNIYLGATKLELNAAYQNTGLTHFGETNVYELQMQLATLTYEVKLQLPSKGSSAYMVGFQGMNQENANLNDRETILLPNALVNNYSGYGFLQQTWGHIIVQSGLRYDFKTLHTESVGNPTDVESYRSALDKRYGSFSGSVGLTYHPSEELFFRSNLASAFRTPNLAELTSNGPHEAIFERGDATLQPEKSLEYDLSAHWHKKYFTMDVAGFYNRVNNFLFQAPTGVRTSAGMPIYQYMQADSKLFGGEAGLHIHPAELPWLHFETTYAWVIGKQLSGNYLPFIPAHKLNVELRGEMDRLAFFKQVFAGLKTHIAFNQNKPSPEETTTPGYQLFDLNLGGTAYLSKQALNLGLSVNNIFNVKYIDHLSTLKEVGAFNPGRDVVVSFKVPFQI